MFRSILRDARVAIRLAACAPLLAVPAVALAQDCDGDGVTDAAEIAAPLKIAVCIDPRIVNVCEGSCACEVGNVLAVMSQIGTTTTFTDASGAQVAALLASGQIVVIPEQEVAPIMSVLGADANAVRDAVLAGGRIVVFGDADECDAQLLNFLITGNPGGPLASASGDPLVRSVAVPVEFASMPSALNYQDGTFPLGGWEPSNVIYGGVNCAGVAMRPVGDGAVGFIAYDFFCPDGSANAENWINAAKQIVRVFDDHGQRDCNGNDIPDSCDIAADLDGGLTSDCDGDGRPDACQFVPGASQDLDEDMILDACEDDDGDGVSNAADRCPMVPGQGSCLGCPPEVCDRQDRDVTGPLVEIACSGGTVSGTFGTAQLPLALSPVTISAHADANVGRLDDEFLHIVVDGTTLPDIHDPESSGCGWRMSERTVSANEFNSMIADGTIAYSVTSGSRTDCYCANTCYLRFRYEAAGQPGAGSDFDRDGVAIEIDPCPATAGGSDADDDDDLRADTDDAYPCVPSKQDVDAAYSPFAIAAFLGHSSVATVDGTGMSQEQLKAVADGAAGIAPNGIGGVFTITGELSPAQIDAILAKVQPGSGFVGAAVVTVNASGMTDLQLVEVAQGIAAITAVDDLTVTSSLSAPSIGALVSKARDALVVAGGMSTEQVAAFGAHASNIADGGISGNFTISKLSDPEAITGILARTAVGAFVTIDASLMSDGQLAAVAGSIGAISSVQDVIVSSNLSAAQIAAIVGKAPADEATVHATGMSPDQLRAGISGASRARITGFAVVTAAFGAGEIAEVAASLISPASIRFETAGMSTEQMDAVDAAIAAIVAANGGVNPYCDTTDGDADGFFVDACESTVVDCDDTGPRYVDADGDGIGSSETAGCGVPFYGDRCPTDPEKRTPGHCGCGQPETDADADGTPDCAEGREILTLVPHAAPAAGSEFVVRVHTSAATQPGTVFTGLQLAMYFDTEWLHLERVDLAPGGGLTLEIDERADNSRGELRYFVGLAEEVSASGAARGLVDLVFSLKKAPLCGRASLVGFTNIGPFSSLLATNDGGVVVPVAVDLDNRDLDVLPPVLSGVPDSVAEIPVDTDRGNGAIVSAPGQPITASDQCSGSLPVSLRVTYPNGDTGSSWPDQGVFPIGTTTLEWTAVDESGRLGRETRTVTVGGYQVLELAVSLEGVIEGATTRTVRIRGTGGGTPWELTEEVEFPVTPSGAQRSTRLLHLQIPPRAVQDCITVKSVLHSLARRATPVAHPPARRFTATADLVQGDSNDSNSVDIIDFSIFAAARSSSTLPESTESRRAVSNFNGDLLIGTADFTFIGNSFFKNGDSCSAGFAGEEPMRRVSVKELRRRGLGHLVVADINRDGWVDLRDIEAYMRGDNGLIADN